MDEQGHTQTESRNLQRLEAITLKGILRNSLSSQGS